MAETVRVKKKAMLNALFVTPLSLSSKSFLHFPVCNTVTVLLCHLELHSVYQ